MVQKIREKPKAKYKLYKLGSMEACHTKCKATQGKYRYPSLNQKMMQPYCNLLAQCNLWAMAANQKRAFPVQLTANPK